MKAFRSRQSPIGHLLPGDDMATPGTIYHCCFDLDAIIRRGEAGRMAGRVKLAGTETWATEAELITHATILKARGFEVLPTCAEYDARGHCRGHAPEHD